MSDNVWFTSDTHYFHARIMEFCPNTRRGADADEMTELAIQAHNYQVKPGDRVYHGGDFCFRSKEHIEKVLKRLNGQIHLVLGNHDKHIAKNDALRAMFASVSVEKRVTIGDNQFFISHAPKAEWVDCHKGVYHLHGHTHGNTKNLEYQQRFRFMDIGIDARNDNLMYPWHIDEVLRKLKNREIMTHH